MQEKWASACGMVTPCGILRGGERTGGPGPVVLVEMARCYRLQQGGRFLREGLHVESLERTGLPSAPRAKQCDLPGTAVRAGTASYASSAVPLHQSYRCFHGEWVAVGMRYSGFISVAMSLVSHGAHVSKCRSCLHSQNGGSSSPMS